VAISVDAGKPTTTEQWVQHAYDLIVQDYQQYPQNYDVPADGIRRLMKRVVYRRWVELDLVLAAFCYAAARGYRLKLAYIAMLMRAAEGRTLREVVFVDYKATRRDDPRIT
jgi:hypothetical protein